MRFNFPRGPLRRAIEELDEPEIAGEYALRLAGARVAVADYRLLQHDFPQLGDAALLARRPELAALDAGRRATAVRRAIDRWLIAHAAVVSRRQAAQQEVNTPIAVAGGRVRVFRPPRYGRTLIVPVGGRRRGGGDGGDPPWAGEPAGLLEVKGAGVGPTEEPAFDAHGDGLMLLGEALADLVFERVIDAAFRHAGGRFRAVPTYAVLDAGFDNLLEGGERGPAGLQVRRAHRRRRGGSDLPARGTVEERVKFEIEMLLRHFGITSANPGTTLALETDEDGAPVVTYGGIRETEYWTAGQQLAAFRRRAGAGGPRRLEAINVQTAREVGDRPAGAQLVDFGHYGVRERFELPVVSTVSDRVLRWGGSLAPESPHFVQPEPALALPVEHWGEPSAEERAATTGLPHYAFGSRVHLLAFELARRFRAGEADAEEVAAKLAAPVAAAIAQLQGAK